MYKKSPLTSMRRISDGITTAESRFKLPPLSSSSHTPTSLPPLPQDMIHGDYRPPSSSHSNVDTIKKEYGTTSFSYSYPEVQQNKREEYYYPVYNKHEWSEDESFLPVVENPKIKRKREMDDRIQEINREFLDNREVLYDEKIKQLQDELIAVETGHHEAFHSSIADLEYNRRETIHNARLMMIYQISTVDEQCKLTSKKVHEESIAERKEIQNSLFSIIEEKRKKLKEDKDGEGDPSNCNGNSNNQQHQTRNRKRLLRKRNELETFLHSGNSSSGGGGSGGNSNVPMTANQKRKQDRLKENPAHLIGVLTHRVEEDIEADYYEMIRKK